MTIKRIKWLVAIVPAVCIGIFEFVRHEFLHIISMEWGNVLVAVFSGLIFLLFSHGIFVFMEKLYGKLQREKRESAVLQERYRIAHNLHDSIAQSLFFMNVKLLELETACKKGQSPWQEIDDLRAAIRFADTELRQNILILQNVSVEENIDLVGMLQDQLRQHEEQTGAKVSLVISFADKVPFSPYECKKILHIFNELMLNIRKHAAATKVNVSLNKSDGKFTLIVADNGKGFVQTEKQYGRYSLGYKLLQNDLEDIGAVMDIISKPRQGTTVKVEKNMLREMPIL